MARFSFSYQWRDTTSLSLSLPQPSHRASSLPQSPINLPVKQILGLTSCAPVVRFIQPPAARKSAETIFKARRGGGGGGTARRRKRAGHGVKNGGGSLENRGGGRGRVTSCISSPKIVGESVRKRAVAKSRYNRTGGPCSRGTRISVFWCVDPFRDFHPSAREILS